MRPPHAALTLLCASLALLPGCESGGGTVGAGSGFGDGGSSDAATSSGGGISEPGPGLAPADVPQEDSPGNATADDQDAGPDAAGGDPGSDASDPAGAAPGPCEGLDIRIIRNVTWPSGGSELTLRVVDHSTGAPRADDVGGCFALTGSSTLGQAVLRVALPAEHLVLTLSSPVQGESPAALAEAVTAFIQGRPAGERIALFGWGASL